MADAVDAHEAAQAPPTSKATGPPSMPAVSIDETPTEPATSPRTRPVPFYVEELPTSYDGRLVHRRNRKGLSAKWMVNDGGYTDEEFDALLRKARQDIQQLRRCGTWRRRKLFDGSMRAHMTRSVQEWERRDGSSEISQITVMFHVVHLQQELPLCVHFLVSMQHFVKVIPLWLHIHNQSSRRLRRLWEGRCHQSSIQTRNLQGLVLQCSLHHQRHHVQMQLKA